MAPDHEKCFHTFTHCLGCQWRLQTAQKWRTAEDKNRSKTLCFVLGQPRLLKFSYLPLIPASLEEIDFLLLDAESVWAKVRIAIAASLAEMWHTAGVSLPSQLAPALASLAPLCKLTSRLGHWFQSWTWEPATSRSPVISSLQPGIHSQYSQEDAGRAGRAGECPAPRLGWGVTPAHPGERWGVSSREASLRNGGNGMLEHRHSSIQTSEGNSANLNKQTETQREENCTFWICCCSSCARLTLNVITMDAMVQLLIESKLLSPFLVLHWCHFIDRLNIISFA